MAFENIHVSGPERAERSQPGTLKNFKPDLLSEASYSPGSRKPLAPGHPSANQYIPWDDTAMAKAYVQGTSTGLASIES